MSSYFFLQADKNASNASFLEKLQDYAENCKSLTYVLDRPLTDQKYAYGYQDALIVLSPKTKVLIINFGTNEEDFENYVEDVIEDVGSISDKYLYKDVIGRTRQWRQTLLEFETNAKSIVGIEDWMGQYALPDDADRKKIDLLISLFIGSINDIDRVKADVPETTLDKVKQKIQLFDGDQTRFVYQNINKKRVTIQGLSGTGKTELLLHKLKDLYVGDSSSKIYFTCHNKILADNLRSRIPSFFNFMKVEQQIEWEDRLWCTHAWGSGSHIHSGAYRYICAFYQIPFYSWSRQMSFSRACELALNDIRTKYSNGELKTAFTYMFIDESQDFDEYFFELCELITEKRVYIAGDIFQSIFDESFSDSIDPDFLLGKCYRTDPKTLMFSHALGMGLFEDKKLRWLEEKEWRDCGYDVKIRKGMYCLSREPLRRFEDLEDSFESINILEITKTYSDTIVGLIKSIQRENKTVKPEDIGIVMLDQANHTYELADVLEIKIQQECGWGVNKAYESKEKKRDAVFVSNRNNVKGLEFPFVICVTRAIKDSSSYRNSLYTMLTRSFIQSYLLIPQNSSSGLTNEMKRGLKEIVTTNQMIIKEPSEAEKQKIRTRFEYRLKRLSHFDLMMEIFDELKVDRKYHEKLLQATQQFDMIDSDKESLTSFVKDNLKYVKE